MLGQAKFLSLIEIDRKLNTNVQSVELSCPKSHMELI